MQFTQNDPVNAFMEDLSSMSPEKLAIVESIRQKFLSADDRLVEGIKYGGLVFNHSDELIAGIFPYKKHISIEFSNGADFSDPSGLLEGQGKRRRHLKIFEKQDVDAKQVAAFIAQAVAR